ncbi:MAG: DUF3179 domain-containing protein [Nitrospirota bacterium]|nr:DUF3179 domain-containing protein [Nitrospirota bacterium]
MNETQPSLFPAAPSRNTLWIHITSPRWRWILFVGVGAVLILAVWLGFGRSAKTQFDLTRYNIPLDQIVEGGPAKDGIPAILAPRFVTANDATYLANKDRVLGLSLGTEAKAYPIKILNWHEVVNDRVGGKDVFISYCPLCGTGMAFDSTINGRPHTFGVSGLVYQSNVLIYDHQTESLWSQIGMQAVTGPLTGEKLTPIFLEHTTWSEWHTAHPTTLVLSTKTGSFRNYDRDPYIGYAENRELFFDTAHFDPRYHPKEWVVGIELNGVTKAYAFSEIKKVRSPIHDQLGGQAITIHADLQARSVSVTDATGRPLPSVMAYWFAWYTFHPKTEIFTAH